MVYYENFDRNSSYFTVPEINSLQFHVIWWRMKVWKPDSFVFTFINAYKIGGYQLIPYQDEPYDLLTYLALFCVAFCGVFVFQSCAKTIGGQHATTVSKYRVDSRWRPQRLHWRDGTPGCHHTQLGQIDCSGYTICQCPMPVTHVQPFPGRDYDRIAAIHNGDLWVYSGWPDPEYQWSYQKSDYDAAVL